MKTSVVILNWNGLKFLQQFLSSVVANATDSETEVVVADNGSTDDSVNYIEQNFPQVRVIKFDQNYGFTGGYNRALDQVSSTYTVLLNSDVDTPKGWLQPLVQQMDSNKKIGACMPKILACNRPEYFEYAGGAGGFLDVLGYPFCRGRILDAVEVDKGQYDNTRNIFWATGACMMVRTEAYKQLGGLDDDFFAHMEEIDLCWRMQNEGYLIQCVGQSKVYHVGGGTLPNNNPRKLFFNYRNNLLMLYKNLPQKSRYVVLAIRLLMDWASAVVFLLQGKFSFTKSIFKAHWEFRKMRKGKRQPHNHPLKTLQGVYQWSILISYFLTGKRTFSRIMDKQN
ncbi:MAG: glycosyltransferase family 2 protein [Prevotellaceae bacterium]|nr:glycosyltransferase family 2 protein [Prevotellaceae bacterium]